MKVTKLIADIQASDLSGVCNCGHEFKLKDAIIFDGTAEFPENALEVMNQYEEEYQNILTNFEKSKKYATEHSKASSKGSNLGQNLEKVLPTMKDFNWKLPDTRFLGSPIDYVVFEGLSDGNLDSIGFVEVKSGTGRLNHNQRSVKLAIEENRVNYKEIK